MSDFLAKLNPQQRKAVETTEEPLLIIAGAGTGKTSVISHRIAHIIDKKLARPSEILALTFTEKAAGEMEDRVDVLVPYGYIDTWISTFHAFGDRILRENALDLGLSPDFRVLTKPEQVLFFQQNLFRFDLSYFRPLSNPTKFIGAILNHFSRIKDEDIAPEEYLKFAKDFKGDAKEKEKYQELARVFSQYEELKSQAGLLDFGDQIVLTLKLFRKYPKILAEHQEKFKYILVDEYQDTNFAQNQNVKMLAGKHKNICVCGDDDQCLPPGSLISTLTGKKKIETLKVGDEIVTAVGKGHLGTSKITRVFKNRKKTRFLTFTTEKGHKVTVTDNHKMFCYVPVRKKDRCFHYVYLMYRQNLGWRIGVTDDLVQRLKLERSADKIVGLRSFLTDAEARYWEMFWALKYGIPPVIFKPRGNAIIGDKLYQEFDTQKAASDLARNLKIDLDNPHYCLDAVTRGFSNRVKINVYLCARKYISKSAKKYGRILKNPSITHCVSIQTTNRSVIEKLKARGIFAKKRKEGYVVRFESPNLLKIRDFALKLEKITGGFIEGKFSLGSLNFKNLPALVLPAGNVLPGHYLPIIEGFRVKYDKIIEVVEKTKEQTVYDLEIDRTHNFIANNVVVHNSIYKFRGAAISNILEFRKNFPKAGEIVLTQNYRSSQAILDSAYKLIVNNNPDRLEVKNKIVKVLKSSQKARGAAPKKLFGATISEETDLVISEIEKIKKSTNFNWRDFAILVRANSHAQSFIQTLNLHQIPFKFSGSSGLYEREEIRLLIAFLTSISSFSDSLNLYNLAISELYDLEISDCVKIMDFCRRKNIALFDAFEKIRNLQIEVSAESQTTIEKIVFDLKKFLELSKKEPIGKVLYQFLEDSGYLKKLEREASAESEQKIQNIAKFFEKISSFSKLASDESVKNFVSYLEVIRSAGEDSETAEIDPELDAVNVLTVHAAKGLEFKVVFLVNLVADRFPSRERSETIPVPDALIRETLPSGDFHLQEERRLFYVGMTRACDLLYFSYARDYGGKRLKKVSFFVLEALGEKEREVKVVKILPLEKIKKAALEKPGQLLLLESKIIKLNQQQIDDYLTCPLKYKYASILRIPILKHHAVVYGFAMHKAVEEFFRQKQLGKILPLSELLSVFENTWEGEGFLTAEHEAKRVEQGRLSLADFWERESKKQEKPTFIEKPFKFSLGDVVMGGRWDRVDVSSNFVKITDFKSSEGIDEEKAKRRAKESIQLGVYSLAYKKIYGRLPNVVGLYFLESGVVGEFGPDEKTVEKTESQIKEVEEGIKEDNFQASPSYMACQYCAYNSICPFTATKA